MKTGAEIRPKRGRPLVTAAESTQQTPGDRQVDAFILTLCFIVILRENEEEWTRKVHNCQHNFNS